MISSSCGVDRRPSTVSIRGTLGMDQRVPSDSSCKSFCVGRRLLNSEILRVGGARPRGVPDALKAIYDGFVATTVTD